MICLHCRAQEHDLCRGGTHCFCQHGVKQTKTRAKPRVIMVGDYTPPAEVPSNGNGNQGEDSGP